jgi:hypothetical protein
VRVAVALTLTVAAVLVGAVVALSAERERLAGTNNVFDRFGNVSFSPRQQACAEAELLPGDTGAVRVHAEPAGPLSVRITAGGRELARGSWRGGREAGEIDLPVRPVIERTHEDVELCFRNEGSDTITLWGYGAVPPQQTVIAGTPVGERIRLSYVRPGRESGWEVVGAVAHRMGLVRGSWLEGWAFFGWLAALAGALAVVFVAALRGLRS